MKTNIIYNDDASILLRDKNKFPDNSIDLIITSPPYSNRRNHTYGGVEPNDYIDWFLPISKEMFRILKPSGSFILNIKEGAKNGEKETYVIELIMELKKQKWLWIEEYCWHKSNAMPGKWPNRFRDAWERCLHFTKNKNFKMNQESVMVPIGDWSKSRIKSMQGKNANKNDWMRKKSANNEKSARNVSNWIDRDLVYPDNVIYGSGETRNKNHSAAFPEYLPSWFIKLFTDKNDIVLDPFVGSGTSAIASNNLSRRYIGIEKDKDHAELSRSNLQKLEEQLKFDCE